MLNLTAVLFTSVLGIGGNPLYNFACVISVYEKSVSVRLHVNTLEVAIKINHDQCERAMITILR